jgi:hypothetical protein
MLKGKLSYEGLCLRNGHVAIQISRIQATVRYFQASNKTLALALLDWAR